MALKRTRAARREKSDAKANKSMAADGDVSSSVPLAATSGD